MKRLISSFAALVAVACLVSACGQKGPLYLPEDGDNGKAHRSHQHQPKAKPAPAPKAKAKPDADKAPRAKQTRGVEKQGILVRLPLAELATLDKAKPKDESRAAFALRLIRERMASDTEAKKAARKKA